MYWDNKLNEELLVDNINNIFINNSDMIIKDDQFTKILQQQCGKKRLNVIEKIIKNNDEKRLHNVQRN